MATDAFQFDVETVDGLQWAAVVLAVLTGVVHVYVGIAEGRLPLVLAGLGFFGAVVLFLANYRRRTLYLVGVVYVLAQVVAWAVVRVGSYTPVGYADKAIQVALIAVLAYLFWAE